ncbi:MAG: 3-dehydro-scyllo-inosose hydrolase [Rectinemataceae bacterium]
MSSEKWTIPPQGGHMDRATSIYYQTMNGKQIEERLKVNDVLILPIGSTENHGKNACSGEDTFLVTRLAEAVAQKTGCTVAEPIWYGSHPFHHLGMPGTVVIPEEDLAAYIRAVVAGFWNSGFRKIILLNGHGQDYVIPLAIHQFAKKYQVPAILVNVNWWFVIPQYLRDKKHGGVFETPFVHADEVETSYSMALFPEMVDQSFAEKTKPMKIFPDGHINKSGSVYRDEAPIDFWLQVGASAIEVVSTPEGVVGDATLADPEKARPGVYAILDYLEKLITDILKMYPAGKLPPIEAMSMRDRKVVEDVLKGPLNGGTHLYTLGYPT